MTLNHNGKVAVAPCGHTGETIIGTYVRCLAGCEGPKLISKRGVAGHVDNCACKPCQYRRKTHYITMRDRTGKEYIKVEWDGSSNDILGKMDIEEVVMIRAFSFLDEYGEVVVKGMCQAYVYPGNLTVRADKLLESVLEGKAARSSIYQSNQTQDEGFIRVMNAQAKALAAALAPTGPGPRATGAVVGNTVVKGP